MKRICARIRHWRVSSRVDVPGIKLFSVTRQTSINRSIGFSRNTSASLTTLRRVKRSSSIQYSQIHDNIPLYKEVQHQHQLTRLCRIHLDQCGARCCCRAALCQTCTTSRCEPPTSHSHGTGSITGDRAHAYDTSVTLQPLRSCATRPVVVGQDVETRSLPSASPQRE